MVNVNLVWKREARAFFPVSDVTPGGVSKAGARTGHSRIYRPNGELCHSCVCVRHALKSEA